MDLPLRRAGTRHTMKHPGSRSVPGYPCLSTFKENRMTWETPQAVDMRWGFEITMYIANR
jgi:coenzyme PQQ precursor peptide PqqA